MSAWTPLRYVRQNLLIGPGGDAAALYRLPTIAYAFLPVAEKRRWLRRMERLAITIGANFSLYRVTRSHDPGRYVRDTLALLDPTRQGTEAFTDLLGHHEARLRALASHVPEVYLAVALAEDQTTGALGGDMVRALDRARRRLEGLAGVATPQPISRRELQALAAVEQRTFHLLQGVIDAERATTHEIEWFLRRAACRGLDAPELERHWAPDALIVDPDDPDRVAYEPLTHDLVRLLNAPIVEPPSVPARLVVQTEHGDSHQALLAVGALADAAEFPGPLSELLYAPLEGVPFAVDAALHAEWVGNRQALGQVRRRIVDAEQVFRDQTDGSIRGPGFTEEENRILAREYEAILQSSAHPPMLRASISLAVAAPAADELERRVDALREQYGQVQLHRPRGLQEALWLEHLPRPDQGRVRDYTAQMTVEQFGALMPIGTQHVGSDPGIYLGISGGAGGRPVRYDPTAPSRQSRASAVLLAGTLGSGKTLAAQLIALHAERRGSTVVDLDPKPDHALHQLPELAGRVEVLELSGAPEQRGRLDPLQIGLPDLREDLAASYYLALLRDPPASWEHAIQRAVRDALRAGERSSLRVVDRLRAAATDSTAAGEVADALEVAADFGLARLGFGDGTTAALDAASVAPVTTIRTPGLTLPDPRAGRETYTRSERVSVATLSLVAAFAMALVSGDRRQHKLVVLDEAWFLLSSTQGRALIDRLVRLGRACNATVVLATQRLEDAGELSDLIGTAFIFGQESDGEAQQALHLLGLDPDDAGLVARVRQYRKGRCLMRDLDGRVGEVQIDAAVPGLLDALDTTPKTGADA